MRGMSYGHDYSRGITGEPHQRLSALADAIDWVLKWQEREASTMEGD